MLPGDWHVPLAEAAIAAGANFVSSSYIAPEMRALDAAAKAADVRVINEVGLDPGIDHLMAHDLVAAYKASDAYDPANEISFTSYCGGVPKIANAFRYKFSWAPAGVLKALRSPSKSIRQFSELNVQRPWDAISRYDAPLDPPETRGDDLIRDVSVDVDVRLDYESERQYQQSQRGTPPDTVEIPVPHFPEEEPDAAERNLPARQFRLSMGRTDIASYLRSTLETVSRSFSALQREGFVHVRGKNVQIIDEPAMRDRFLLV